MRDIEGMTESGQADIVKLQFADLQGQLKSVEIPGGRRERLERNPVSAGLDAVLGEDSQDRTTIYLKPFWETELSMPWEAGAGETARVMCSVADASGTPLWCDSREVLRRTLFALRQEGLAFQVRLGCEFFLFHTDEEARATAVTHDTAGSCDGGTLDLAESIRRDIILSLLEAGISVEYASHGGAPGQHFVCLEAREALQAADEFLAFKAAAKRIAKSHGLHASFMPRPLNSCAGSGLVFEIAPEFEAEGRQEEIEGLLNRAKRRLQAQLGEMALVTNPTVNSYRRLAAMSQREKDPEAFVEGTGKELCFRLADPSANLYLALAAALEGGFSEDKEAAEPVSLPLNLGEAAELFYRSSGMKQLLGNRLFSFYYDRKKREWERFSSWVTDWELREYLSRC